MKVEFTLALAADRHVVLEQRPNFPLIVHTFDSTKDLLEFYEQYRPEPLDAETRRKIEKAGLQWEVLNCRPC